MNLKGIDHSDFDEILHPDLLGYLRDVRHKGMAARFEGKRARIRAGLHPNAKRNLEQVFVQVAKDVGKHRVLVADADHLALHGTVASPFEAVDKMLPDRSISSEKRIVHDQRGVNGGTSKFWHPPALQLAHVQISRRILWEKCRSPGVPVLMAKKDISGAFRLLWVSPEDVELFAGELPWRPDQAFPLHSETEDAMAEFREVVVIYLVSSFGFSGSPGEWSAWGRATEEFHRSHRPAEPRRDLKRGFDAKVLVDDCILVEPWVGLRPWISAEVFEDGVRRMLGAKAVNAEKDAVEGSYKTSQTVWGVVMETDTMKAFLPEKRIQKGAALLQRPSFDYGQTSVTLKELQQFRGIMTGWAAIIPSLNNELGACDKFLGGTDGGAPAQPKIRGEGSRAQELQWSWEDLWELFDVCRWLSARSEAWDSTFSTSLKSMLPPLERVGLPGEWKGSVFVSSDATPSKVGAIDWKYGKVFRADASQVRAWAERALGHLGEGVDGDLVIHLGEMLSFLAFACHVAAQWEDQVIVYGGDNQIVKYWLQTRKAKVRAGRILIRVLNMLEMRFHFSVLAGWWRTFHNVDADFITRCTDSEFEEMCVKRGWEVVDVSQAVEQALRDSQLFGPCFLGWSSVEERQLLLQLKDRRVQRQVQEPISIPWDYISVVEWAPFGRQICDFSSAAGSRGAQIDGPPKPGQPMMFCATVGADPQGRLLRKVIQLGVDQGAWLVMVEGPRQADWEHARVLCERNGWGEGLLDFVTSEFGEVLARHRKCLLVSTKGSLPATWEQCFVKALAAAPASSVLTTPAWEDLAWRKPYKIVLDSCIPRKPMMPIVVGHYWEEESGERKTLHSLGGPVRWPLYDQSTKQMEKVSVYDRRGPPGQLRDLSSEEVWRLQGRHPRELEELGCTAEEGILQGTRATGVQTATNLLAGAGHVLMAYMEDEKEGQNHERSSQKAGMARDDAGGDALAQLLVWLRQWKLGHHPRIAPEYAGLSSVPADSTRAGGSAEGWSGRTIWRWAESWWLEQLGEDDSENEQGTNMENQTYAGGRKSKKTPEQVAEAVGEATLAQLREQVRPFCGQVKELVDEWLEEHMTGDKAEATNRAYASSWEKWKFFARRQGWSEFLKPNEDLVENENKVLGFLGYLGWLGASVNTLRQAVFGLKDRHKRAGCGDPFAKMHRIWILTNAMDRQAVRKPRRLGVTANMLVWLGEHLCDPLENEGIRNTTWSDAVMVMGAMVTAWFFMLRAKEYADSNGVDENMILRGCDLRFSHNGLPSPPGEASEVTLTFRKTKADQLGFGDSKLLKSTGRHHLCPVEALERMRKVWPLRFQDGKTEATRPLFRWSSGKVLNRGEIQVLLQRAARGVGLPPERFLSHSLRIGGATALYQSTMDVELVKRMGRWTSSAVHRYLQDGGGLIPKVAERMATMGEKEATRTL